MVAEQLDRPDGWGRAALSARAAIAAIECMESELDDAAFMMKTLVSQGDREIKHLRSALEQIRVLALHETYGSSAGYKGIADRLAGELLKVTTIAREALRGAVQQVETAACTHNHVVLIAGTQCVDCEKTWISTRRKVAGLRVTAKTESAK